jgi:CheY-like chemotaxis protein
LDRDPCVLLIDNDVRNVELLRTILEVNGYEADLVTNGGDALMKLAEKRYSCIITDFVLEDIRGDELAEMIRADHPSVPILLITGFRSQIEPSRLEGFVHVFDKPTDPRQVLIVLSHVMPKVRY